MGTFSPQHWIVAIIVLAHFAMVVHVAISPKTNGTKKAVFIIALLLIPYLPYFIWLALKDTKLTTTAYSKNDPRAAAKSISQKKQPSETTTFNNKLEISPSNETFSIENDEKLYRVVFEELQGKNGGYRDSLWVKCAVENNGDEKATRISYIRYRVNELKQQVKVFTEVAATSDIKSSEKTDDIDAYLLKEFPKITDEDRLKARRVSPTQEIERLFKTLENSASQLEDIFIEKPYLVVATSRNGESLLMKSVSLERKDLCHLLISKGADPHAINKWGYSPYTLAQKKQWEWFVERFKKD